jgi:hypothetical protein
MAPVGILPSAARRAEGPGVAARAASSSLSSPAPVPDGLQAPGLVVTLHNAARKDYAGGLADVLGVRFPGVADVKAAAAALQDVSRETTVGSLIEVSPGSIRFRRMIPPDEPVPTDQENVASKKAITGWSVQSRRQMLRSFAALDYAPLYAEGGMPARVTLTYPADWLPVASSGADVKRHLDVLERRFVRAWGEPLMCLWKLEFQRRGAPHIHFLMRRPNGLAGHHRPARLRNRRAYADGLRFGGVGGWLALTWADIVAHPDPAERAAHELAGTQVDVKDALRVTDPKRASVYFSKHGAWKGSKEYQNHIPAEWRESGAGPGRFWGYRGLRPVVISAQVDGGKDYQLAKRAMRRWSARTRIWDRETLSVRYVKTTKPVRVQRGNRVRTVRRPVVRLRGPSGTLCVNDGPAMARELARLIALTVEWDRQAAGARTGADVMARGMRLAELRRAKASRCGVPGCGRPGRSYMVGQRCDGHAPVGGRMVDGPGGFDGIPACPATLATLDGNGQSGTNGSPVSGGHSQ